MHARTLIRSLVFWFTLAAGPAWADGEGQPPERLGEVSFATTCQSAVQPGFTRAVALLHSFWFSEGEKAFRAVLAQDPDCAVAHWGIAAILIGNTFAGGATPDDAPFARNPQDRARPEPACVSGARHSRRAWGRRSVRSHHRAASGGWWPGWPCCHCSVPTAPTHDCPGIRHRAKAARSRLPSP